MAEHSHGVAPEHIHWKRHVDDAVFHMGLALRALDDAVDKTSSRAATHAICVWQGVLRKVVNQARHVLRGGSDRQIVRQAKRMAK